MSSRRPARPKTTVRPTRGFSRDAPVESPLLFRLLLLHAAISAYHWSGRCERLSRCTPLAGCVGGRAEEERRSVWVGIGLNRGAGDVLVEEILDPESVPVKISGEGLGEFAALLGKVLHDAFSKADPQHESAAGHAQPWGTSQRRRRPGAGRTLHAAALSGHGLGQRRGKAHAAPPPPAALPSSPRCFSSFQGPPCKCIHGTHLPLPHRPSPGSPKTPSPSSPRRNAMCTSAPLRPTR